MTTLEGGVIGEPVGRPEFPLWVPNDQTPLIPLQALFIAAQQSVLDNLIKLRNRVQSVQTFTGSDVLDTPSGWQQQTVTLHILGETYGYLYYQLSKTGSALPVPSDGNVGNPIIGQLKAQFTPRSESSLGSGDAGRLASAYVLSSGQVKLSALNSGADVAVNDNLTFAGGFILGSPVLLPY